MTPCQDQHDARFEEVFPLLDQAIDQLTAADRAAIILRYFERRDFRAVGRTLRITDDAAQKRVSRALDKLRVLLLRRGLVLSGAGLAALLGAQAITAAPPGLAAGVSLAALAGSASGTGLFAALLRLLGTAKFKVSATALVLAAVGGTTLLEGRAQERLRHEADLLQEKA